MDSVVANSENDILISDWLRSWEKFGRNNFLATCKKLNIDGIIEALFDLAKKIISGEGKADYFNSVLVELAKAYEDAEFESKLADMLWILDNYCTQIVEDEKKKICMKILTYSQHCVSEPLLKERLCDETLEAMQIIPSKQLFQTRYVKTKTRLFYKQQKFNLLREENEGYSKLITELVQFTSGVESILGQVHSLIGYFDLDPNRVLDLILDVLELRPPSVQLELIGLLRSYNPDPLDLAHTVGHKFHFSQECKEESAVSLYRMTALLIHQDILKLDPLYPHLSPGDKAIREFCFQELEEAKSRKPTVQSSDPDKKDLPKEDPNKAMNELREQHYSNNQKIGLCEALLELGDWDNAKTILNRFPEYYPTNYPPLASCLCSLLQHMIDPVYKKQCRLAKCVQLHRKKVFGSFAVSQCSDLLDLIRRALPIAIILGHNMSIDIVLMVKLCRIGQSFLEQRSNDTVDIVYQGFFNLIDEVLLPSLSLIDSNCSLAEEIWEMVRHMSYEHRYRIYGQWKHGMSQSQPRLITRKAECISRIKYIMKRLTQDNVKPLGRQIGKLCHSNPGIVFDYVINTVLLYDNLIVHVVEAFKYLGSLSYDVLAYCLLEMLSNTKKPKLGDLQLNPWFQWLCTFTGLLCKKYSFDLAGLLQYVLNQLKDGKSHDLLVLSEVLHKMTGIEQSEEMTAEQIEASSGGEVLRQEASYFSQVRNTRRTSNRLKDTLMTHQLALPLAYMMARQRDSCVFVEDSDRHLKLAGKLYDHCQDTLVQFGTFLSLQLSTDELTRQSPSIDVLIGKYHLPADAAFFLLRSVYAQKISIHETIFAEKLKVKGVAQDSDKVKMAYVEASSSVLEDIVTSICPLYPARVWDELNPLFMVTFWTLQSSDIGVPTDAYQRQGDLLRSQIAQLEHDIDQASKRKERDRLLSVLQRLTEEENSRVDHVMRVRCLLEAGKEIWFQTKTSTKTDTITQILQLCIFPRVCFTADDAIYAAKFIHTLHTIKTPNFSTLITLDRIFNDVTLTISSCTENEAHRYGRFLCTILSYVMHWHSSASIFMDECGCFPGFTTLFRKGTVSQDKPHQLDYEDYRQVVHKWHYRTTKAMVSCLESTQYAQIRNALLVLTRILPYYPKVTVFGAAMERRVSKLQEEEKEHRRDLHALAVSYLGQLRQRKSTWIADEAFRIKVEVKKDGVANGSDPKSASNPKAATKRPESGGARVRSSGNTGASGDSAQSTLTKSVSIPSKTALKDERSGKQDDIGRAERSGKHEDGRTGRSSSGHPKEEKRRRVDPVGASGGNPTSSPSKNHYKPIDASKTSNTDKLPKEIKSEPTVTTPKKRVAPEDEERKTPNDERPSTKARRSDTHGHLAKSPSARSDRERRSGSRNSTGPKSSRHVK